MLFVAGPVMSKSFANLFYDRVEIIWAFYHFFENI
jgi:hypothetical protein